MTGASLTRLSPSAIASSVRNAIEEHRPNDALTLMIEAFTRADVPLLNVLGLKLELGLLLLRLDMDAQAVEQFDAALTSPQATVQIRAHGLVGLSVVGSRTGDDELYRSSSEALRREAASRPGEAVEAQHTYVIAHHEYMQGADPLAVAELAARSEAQARRCGDVGAQAAARRLGARAIFPVDPARLKACVDDLVAAEHNVGHDDLLTLANHFRDQSQLPESLHYHKLASRVRQARPIPRLVVEVCAMSHRADVVQALREEARVGALVLRRGEAQRAEHLKVLANQVRGLLADLLLASESLFRGAPDSDRQARFTSLSSALTERIQVVIDQMSLRAGAFTPVIPQDETHDLSAAVEACLKRQQQFLGIAGVELSFDRPVQEIQVAFGANDLDLLLVSVLHGSLAVPGDIRSLRFAIEPVSDGVLLRVESVRLDASKGTTIRTDERIWIDVCELLMRAYGGTLSFDRSDITQTSEMLFRTDLAKLAAVQTPGSMV